MKVTLLVIGKIKHHFFALAEHEYATRIGRFCDFEILKIPDEKRNLPAEKLKKIEARKIRAKLPEKSFVIALDERGEEFSAEKFANFLESLESSGKPIVFVIGGNFGLDAEIVTHADRRLALSKMTLTADLARVVFLENLFRGFTIMRGIPFHK